MADRLRFVAIVGARPQFIKAAVLSRAIRARHEEVIAHTGQHYDPEMSAIFFEEMAIPPPTIQLDSGGGSHAQQTAQKGCRNARSHILADLGLAERSYILVTVHRAGNTDAVSRLRSIIAALDSLDEQVVFPVHPRTRKALDAIGYVPAGNVRLTPPLGYLDMVRLITAARLIMTDSGGLQKEAYWAGVPCVTLRDETDWVETVEHGWNVLVGADSSSIVNAARTFEPPSDRPELYGNTGVAEKCVDLLEDLPRAAGGADRS
jgi:UDP-N-acetylglucosamine 2-epimerase